MQGPLSAAKQRISLAVAVPEDPLDAENI